MLRPTANGFQKRMSFTFSPDANPVDEDLDDRWSTGLLQGLHSFMLSGPTRHEVLLYPDAYARNVWKHVRRAISEWLEAQAAEDEPVNRFLVVKLNFAFSDIMRFTNVCMRMCQYLEALSAAGWGQQTWARTEFNVFELVAGIRAWLRQVELHAAYYAFIRKAEAKVGAELSGSKGAALLADALLGSDPPQRAEKRLKGKDLVKHQVLSQPGAELTSTQLRKALANKAVWRGSGNLAHLLADALQDQISNSNRCFLCALGSLPPPPPGTLCSCDYEHLTVFFPRAGAEAGNLFQKLASPACAQGRLL